MSRLVDIVTAGDAELRDAALDAVARELDLEALLRERSALDELRRRSDNLYERVRALFFLHALHRFHLPTRAGCAARGHVPAEGVAQLFERRFEEALAAFRRAEAEQGVNDALLSAQAAAYHGLGFQTLADQVKRSVRAVRGNRWSFRCGHPLDQPLRVDRALLPQDDAPAPILREETPVRMDLTHSAWSDIFFLGMDYPEGARVLNVSVDLGVRGRDPEPRPPIECHLRVLKRPVLRLVSVDLAAQAELTTVAEVFDFARDYLGLLKAAVIAAGLVPSGLEGSGAALAPLLANVLGPGRGLEISSHVRGIPKGSRLAVSTNLLAGLIALVMRATGQTAALTGALSERERRLVAARAILGEWLGGSGGGWQDSGGVWPGIKLIQGEHAREGDPEHGVSRGRLLPTHALLDGARVHPAMHDALQRSLVLIHGGMAQDVGPILEMVTERYLLRSEAEWAGRAEALGVMDDVLDALERGDVRALAAATSRNFAGPIQTIIPWASNHYTETLIERTRAEFGEQYWGFLMLGGMSGGGMGFFFAPEAKPRAQEWLARSMPALVGELQHALAFGMQPVVYDFAIDAVGTRASLHQDARTTLPAEYHALREAARARDEDEGEDAASKAKERGRSAELESLLSENGFDPAQHEHVRSALRDGRIGLAQNRLPLFTDINEVEPGDVLDLREASDADRARGLEALSAGRVGVVTLAAGSGSRWTQGAGVVKALSPFCRMGGAHRSFLELHLAKSRRRGAEAGTPLPHTITTSYLTHEPIATALERAERFGYPGPLHLSRGRSVGLRMVPTARDLRFAFEETAQQVLDERAQKVKESLHEALVGWAESTGEASDYTDNLAHQCLHPVGHWYEVPNLLLNGTLRRLLDERPQLTTLLLHNIDTVGADVDPALLGRHLQSGATLGFEVVARRIEDTGGGLARVDGRVRLIEGLALPREDDEWKLSYYNTMTTWIEIDGLLAAFDLDRAALADEARVAQAVRQLAERLPTYVTHKEVKKRWGYGQEDVFPVVQWEKLWSDMTLLPDLACAYHAVPRVRGQQLKEPAQLDGWLRDGSGAAVEALCDWGA